MSSEGKKMKNKVLATLALSILVGSLAAPLSAQTITLKANIPFQFVLEGKTMPAGVYLLQKGSSLMVSLQSFAEKSAVLSPVIVSGTLDSGNQNEAKLYFHRYGDQYFLTGIWDGYIDKGLVFPRSHAEGELASGASLEQPETVAVLARL
jgi:subtilisin family serine protease